MNQATLPGTQRLDAPLAPVDELRALYRLTDRLYRARSMRDVYDAALDAILGTLHCERASVLLFSDDGVMDFVTWRGLSDDYRGKLRGHSPWQPGARDQNQLMICKAVVDLAHRFGKKAVGEGIASSGDRKAMAEMGCDIGQGAAIGRTVDKEQLAVLIKQQTRDERGY